MKKLISLILAIMFTLAMLLTIVNFDSYANDLIGGNSKYAAIPPVKLPPVPPKD